MYMNLPSAGTAAARTAATMPVAAISKRPPFAQRHRHASNEPALSPHPVPGYPFVTQKRYATDPNPEA